MNYFFPLLPFVFYLLFLLSTTTFSQLALVNAGVQALVFLWIVCIPAWRTGRLSYVDIAWPWGLVAIGILTFTMSDGYWLRVFFVSLVYGFMGGRMGFAALHLWRLGKLKRELPRYQYQQIRWQNAGKVNTRLVMQVEAILQGVANASFLALPAFVIAANPNTSISLFEILGVCIWLAAYSMETIADVQKGRFLQRMKKQGERNKVCNVGLWQYCRHPNYFAEWMVWNALIIASIPSWLWLYRQESLFAWCALGLGLLYVSRVMYTTLVYYTGAVPSEFYSAQKREGYKDYQEKTNRFFPGPPRNH